MSSAERSVTPPECYKGVYKSKNGTYFFIDGTFSAWLELSPDRAKWKSLEIYGGEKKKNSTKKEDAAVSDSKSQVDPDEVTFTLNDSAASSEALSSPPRDPEALAAADGDLSKVLGVMHPNDGSI